MHSVSTDVGRCSSLVTVGFRRCLHNLSVFNPLLRGEFPRILRLSRINRQFSETGTFGTIPLQRMYKIAETHTTIGFRECQEKFLRKMLPLNQLYLQSRERLSAGIPDGVGFRQNVSLRSVGHLLVVL